MRAAAEASASLTILCVNLAYLSLPYILMSLSVNENISSFLNIISSSVGQSELLSFPFLNSKTSIASALHTPSACGPEVASSGPTYPRVAPVPPVPEPLMMMPWAASGVSAPAPAPPSASVSSCVQPAASMAVAAIAAPASILVMLCCAIYVRLFGFFFLSALQFPYIGMTMSACQLPSI